MADNIAVTAGAGTTVRSVDKAGIQHQVVVLDLGGAGAESLLTTSLPTKDAGPNQTIVRTHTQNDDISTAREITAAPTGGQKIVLVDAIFSVDTDCWFTIEMETSGNVLWGGYVAARTPMQLSPRGYLKGDAADKKLMMQSSVAAKGAVTVVYFSEA